MDKTPQKVTNDPKRQGQGKKSHQTYAKRLKENILRNNQLTTSSSTDNSTPSTSATRSNKKSSQAVNKEQVNEEQQQSIKPSKQRNIH